GMLLAVSTDMLTAGSHFFPDAEPGNLGHKALAVNLSDLAAMGAGPRWATLAIALPEADEKWIAAFAQGFFRLAGRWRTERVGAELLWDSLPRARAIAGCPDKALADDCLLAGGDDYELLFTASKVKRAQIEAVGRDLEIPLALIGAAVPGDPVARLRDARGKLASRPRKGFDHFA